MSPVAALALQKGSLMKNAFPREVTEGSVCGVIAGVLFGIAQIVIADAAARAPLLPLRMAASVVLGGQAVRPMTHPAGIAMLGVLVHLVLSSLFGTTFGALNSALPARFHSRSGWQLALGATFGIVLWVTNFQLIARGMFPWFLRADLTVQALVHVTCFGALLGLLYASAERHALSAPQT